jgi:hypothetical protein
MASRKERIEAIKQRLNETSKTVLGLPLSFLLTKGVQNPVVVAHVTRGVAPPVCDSYMVEVFTPTGVCIDIGQVAFDSESGAMFVVKHTPALQSLLDRMSPGDRY